MLSELAGTVLVAGAVACAAAALRGRTGRLAGLLLAGALVAAASAYAGGAPLWVAGVVAGGGLAACVHHRHPGLPRMAVLDALMGGSAAGAIVVGAGGGAAAGVAAGVVVGGLALSRWQASPAILLVAAGVAAIGMGEQAAPAAAPLFAVAVWRDEPAVGPGPEFRYTVLAAIIVSAVAALTVLAIGQFTTFSDVAGALALVTVVAGIARGGITVTERLRESDARAMTDELTGLANRRHLIERLQEAIERGDDLALLLIDLDGFKELNDTLGHHAGDEVLRQIGPRLAHSVREHDTLARLGGDEFALVLSPGDEATASTAGLRLRGALERSFRVEDIAVHVDASVGIALFPLHARDPLGLLQRADVAMYEAKRMRTGHEVYLPERDRHSRERLALVGELGDAIVAGQLVVHYQPKADLPGGAVRGVEALVRWQHPVRGLLSPGHFLPLAEQSGLTRALTAFVLDRALDEICTLHAELGVAVNLGPADLLDLDLPAEVARALERHTCLPQRLTLEVSEDLVAADPERTLEVLARLRALGVRLALDDFGEGRSSLRHLRDLDLDEIKLDRQFVLGMDTHGRDAAIVAATVDLGHRLGLRVVGEGVASPASWEALSSHGCDEAQGDLLSRPLPVERLGPWLAARRARLRA
ncbi:MAG TPA: bifunctional diguanylate cyclase/phosphodiesterase [Solirubrobacteraceae bacterium]|nr:bifunctional diguanylate cyclase/phosphodiesterase [Solirubrobacteraceae bacterium]